jgi:cytochrome c oxidase assembly protein subunit 19
MNPLITGTPLPARSPPEKGSFPLDHFHECKSIHWKYLRCLKENKNDSFACRGASQDYLQCRMDKNLMKREDMKNLGFRPVDEQESAKRHAAVQEREAELRSRNKKEDEGFTVIKDSLRDQKNWRRPTLLGAGSWSLRNPFKKD